MKLFGGDLVKAFNTFMANKNPKFVVHKDQFLNYLQFEENSNKFHVVD